TGEWVTKSELQKATKGLYPIHSQSIQAVCHKYIHARESAHAARRSAFNNKYPYKQKKNFNTKWTNHGFKVFLNGKIHLSLGLLDGKRQKPLFVWVKKLPVGIRKAQAPWSAPYKLEGMCGDKGNTTTKESMLTYRTNISEVC